MKQISFSQAEQEEGHPPRAVPGPDGGAGALATAHRRAGQKATADAVKVPL